MRLCRSALLIAVLVLGAPASTASVTTNVLSYAADNGEVNNVTLSLASGTYTINDSGATITPGSGCSAVNANQVTCAATSAQIDVRDQADTVTTTSSTAASAATPSTAASAPTPPTTPRASRASR